MGKKYKILDGALDYLRTTAEGDNPEAPVGTPLRQYQDWKKGTRNITYTRSADSLPENLIDVAVNPFYYDVSAASLTKTVMSQRTKGFSGINALRTAANITDPVPATATSLRGFFPAQCTVSVPDSTKDDNNATSQLTGLKYKKKGKRSYTFPYGAKADADRESEVRGNIAAAVVADSNYELQFTSEII